MTAEVVKIVTLYCRRITVVRLKTICMLTELGTANLHSIPQPQIPQNCKWCSATANPQVCDRFAVTFRTSATANAHCTSANLDHIIYCYFVFVMTFCHRPDVDLQKKKVIKSVHFSQAFYRGSGNTACCFADLR